MNVADISKGENDSAGAQILDVYAKNPPLYAVYRTAKRVLIQFADDRKDQDPQRENIAKLNPLPGEINGLIDGWRTHWRQGLKSKAKR